MTSWLVTGANGNLGRRLLSCLLQDPQHSATAVVRSARAAEQIERLELNSEQRTRLAIEIVDYTDVPELTRVASGKEAAVHLVGILKETAAARYSVAHEASTEALRQALETAGVSHVTYLSIVGSHEQARNACLASKGRAEAVLRASSVPAAIVRVPMVLGEGDYASYALRQRASKSVAFTFRADSLEQPIYAGDVVNAICAAADKRLDATIDLGGPEVLSRRELTRRASQLLGHDTRLVSLPLSLGIGMASLMEKLLASPPVTKAMLEVLDHDDDVDSDAARAALGLPGLTSLDDMLRAVLSSSAQ